jgi:hypothetical protein
MQHTKSTSPNPHTLALRYLDVSKHAAKDDEAIVPHPVEHVVFGKCQEASALRRVAGARKAHSCAVKVDGLVCFVLCVCVCVCVCVCLQHGEDRERRFFLRNFSACCAAILRARRGWRGLRSGRGETSSCYLVPTAHHFATAVRTIDELQRPVSLRLIFAEVLNVR